MHQETVIAADCAKSLVGFLNEIENTTADKVNPHFRSRYASLSEVLSTIKPIAKKHGLAYLSITSVSNPLEQNLMLYVHSFFVHESGVQIQAGTVGMNITNYSPQQIGSALTYLRRQSAQAACGISTEIDDDGASASGTTQPAASPPTRPNQLSGPPIRPTK